MEIYPWQDWSLMYRLILRLSRMIRIVLQPVRKLYLYHLESSNPFQYFELMFAPIKRSGSESDPVIRLGL